MCWANPKQNELNYKPVKRAKNQEKKIDSSCPFYNTEGMCAIYQIKKFCRSLSCGRKK